MKLVSALVILLGMTASATATTTTPSVIDYKPPSTAHCAASGENNFIVNGSFEANTVTNIKKWQEFNPLNVAGWKSMNNQTVEIWTTGMGPAATDGVNILEIDRNLDKVDYLYQDIQTVAGQKYEASFYIRARRGAYVYTEDETAVFIWNDQETSYTAARKDEWTKITLIVEGTGGLDRFGIRESTEAGGNTSYGPLLDDFRLVAATCEGDDDGGDPVRFSSFCRARQGPTNGLFLT